MWELYNPNPTGRHVGDCTVRSLSKALGLTWEQAYSKLAAQGFMMADMPSSNAVFGAVLKSNGFKRETIPDSCPDCYTLEDFANDHPDGLFVVGMSGHVATVENGVIFDAWHSEPEIVVYVWRKED